MEFNVSVIYVSEVILHCLDIGRVNRDGIIMRIMLPHTRAGDYSNQLKLTTDLVSPQFTNSMMVKVPTYEPDS